MYKVPPRIRITYKVTYEVVWIDSFVDPEQLGGCCYEDRQIKIKTGMKPRKAFYVFFHELIHAINFERKLKLTEKQTEGLELGLAGVARLNKGFTLK